MDVVSGAILRYSHVISVLGVTMLRVDRVHGRAAELLVVACFTVLLSVGARGAE